MGRHEFFEELICPICGKVFTPASQHSLTDGHGSLVCSPGCSEKARRTDEEKLKAQNDEFDEYERDRRRKLKRYHDKKNGVNPNSEHYGKPVLVFDSDGNYLKKTKSQKEAAELTGCSMSSVSMVCNGKQESTNGFIFKFEKDLFTQTPKYKY